MSTISSLSSSTPPSMLERLQSELSSEVSAGTISSSDETALSDALESIDEAMQSDASSGTSKSPDDVKAKIQSLIDDQVEAGTLTSDQADELSNLFEAASPKDGQGAPPPPPQGGAESSSGSSSTSSSSTLLTDFLATLKSQTGSSSSYGATGSTSSTSSSTSLVLDTIA